jgi:hypothetical protein
MFLYPIIPSWPHVHFVRTSERRGVFAYQLCRCGQGRVRRAQSGGNSPVALGWTPFWGPVPPIPGR